MTQPTIAEELAALREIFQTKCGSDTRLAVFAPKAMKFIERQAAEIERLRGCLSGIAEVIDGHVGHSTASTQINAFLVAGK